MNSTANNIVWPRDYRDNTHAAGTVFVDTNPAAPATARCVSAIGHIFWGGAGLLQIPFFSLLARPCTAGSQRWCAPHRAEIGAPFGLWFLFLTVWVFQV